MADYKRRIKYQKFQLPDVTGAAVESILKTGNTDQNYKYVTGVCVTITGADAAVQDAIQNSILNKFEIASQEIFPQGFEPKLIFFRSDSDIPPDERFLSLRDVNGMLIPFPANNSTIDVTYQDGSFAGIVYPYTVNVWLRLENIDEEMNRQSHKFLHFLWELFNKKDK